MRPESALRPYQQLQTDFVCTRLRGLVWDDVGFGKTAIMATAASRLIQAGAVIRMLVLSTKAIATNTWQDELQEWEHLQWLAPHARALVGLSAPARERAMFSDLTTRIDTLNYEHIPWLESQLQKRQTSLGDYYDMVVADEVTKLKSHQGKWFTSMARMVHPDHVPRFWGMTGTPASEGYHQLWAPVFLADYGTRLGYTYQQYLDRFFIPIGDRPVLRTGAESAVQDSLRDIVTSLSDDDYKVLPPVLYSERRLHLPAKQERDYLRFERELLMHLQKGDVVAANAAVLSGKCMQYTSGAMYLADELGNPTQDWDEVHQLKLDALEQLVDELDGRHLLVAVRFRHEVERIRARFPHAVHMNSANSAEVQRRWNAGEVSLLVTHPASCGHGLNLQRGGSHVCWFSPTHSGEQFEQVIGRLRRPGQPDDHVTVHALLFDGTVDYDAWQAVQGKVSLQSVLKARMALRMEAAA